MNFRAGLSTYEVLDLALLEQVSIAATFARHYSAGESLFGGIDCCAAIRGCRDRFSTYVRTVLSSPEKFPEDRRVPGSYLECLLHEWGSVDWCIPEKVGLLRQSLIDYRNYNI
ncbi:hypothetical protein HYU11_02830 [Candidatus Woesearchaeota archaeon]|nr:hypothetical protein [Candidatus Woesearchaeota archaeon]